MYSVDHPQIRILLDYTGCPIKIASFFLVHISGNIEATKTILHNTENKANGPDSENILMIVIASIFPEI